MKPGAARHGLVVVAKAPVPGLAKTRIGALVGAKMAAELAAASLLDTLDAVEDWAPASRRLIALTGSLKAAASGSEIAGRLAAWTVVKQQGETFADRLVSAHRQAALRWGGNCRVVQIGADTPSITRFDLDAILAPLGGGADVALGPAVDGGWWGIATRRWGYADRLADVPMSRSDTAARTRAALKSAGATVRLVHELRDVDEWHDALAVSAEAPSLRLAEATQRLTPAMA